MTVRCTDLINALERACPASLAEGWDNVGFLVGSRDTEIKSVMTCLTVSPNTVEEAVSCGADLIISHHPFPFRAEKRWTDDAPTGALLLRLIRGGVSVLSPHTAHDSAFWGVNRQLAEIFSLTCVRPLVPGDLAADASMLDGVDAAVPSKLHSELGNPLGGGRIGNFREPVTLGDFIKTVRKLLRQESLTFVGDPACSLSTLAIGCGAADSFVTDAARAGADVLLLGEARFHSALLAEQLGMALVLPGHYATERFAMETMASRLASVFPELTVWASRSEYDPIRYA